MKHSKRYLKAAKRIAKGYQKYSCFAIADTYYFSPYFNIYNYDAVKFYLLLFQDHCIGGEDLQRDIQMSGPRLGKLHNEHCRSLRVLLLCLAAAIAESEGK